MVRNILVTYSDGLDMDRRFRLVEESACIIDGVLKDGSTACLCQLKRNIVIRDLRKLLEPASVVSVPCHVSFDGYVSDMFESVTFRYGTLQLDRWKQCTLWPRPKVISERL